MLSRRACSFRRAKYSLRRFSPPANTATHCANSNRCLRRNRTAIAPLPALRKPPHVDQLFIVCALPLYHIFALTACFLLAVRAGGVNLLIPNPRDMQGFIKELMKYQVNSFPAVNTLYNGLLNSPGFDKVDFSKLKTSFGGGMATQKPVAEKWLKVTGCALSEGYGLSETSPTLTCNPADTDLLFRLRLDQRQRWQQGERVSVESYFVAQPSLQDDDDTVLDLLFREVPTFDDFDRICRPMPELATAPWQRAGYPDICMLERR